MSLLSLPRLAIQTAENIDNLPPQGNLADIAATSSRRAEQLPENFDDGTSGL